MRIWILLTGVSLIGIAAAIWIKSSLLNGQSPVATVVSIGFTAVSVAGALIAIVLPNVLDGLLEILTRPPNRLSSLCINPKRVRLINIGLLTIGIIGIIVVWLIPYTSPSPKVRLTQTPCIGKPTGGSAPFTVYPNYNPSGYVGDTGDITVAMQPDLVRFTYVTKGQGPHEWDYTYIDGTPNPNPAKFAGVLYLNPPNNWGTDSHCGFDLRGRHTLTWKAHSLSGSVYVEFVIGGVVWQWDATTHTKVPVPYPESLPRISLGIKKLTPTWQTFTYDLSALPADYLRSVVAGFGWVITWDSSGGQRTGSEQPQTFIFEIQDVFYV